MENYSSQSQSEEDNRTMLSEQEISWALNIKRVIESHPELDSLSDYAYAQLALIVKDNIQEAVERTQHMQCFREEYDIEN